MPKEDLWIFLVGVTDPHGVEYEDFGEKQVPFYVQLGDDWDKESVRAAFISSGKDEVVDISFENALTYPEGTDCFALLMMKHFSPYAVYDIGDTNTDTTSVNATVTRTGYDMRNKMRSLVLTVFGTAGLLTVMSRKKKRAKGDF